MATRPGEKQVVAQGVDALAPELVLLARRIHEHPELSFQEHEAVKCLTEPLARRGFSVKTGVAGLETAFEASWTGSPGGPQIAFLAEYDALPELGHACGHNLIGAAAVGAALALREACPDLRATIAVVGTPAEEDGGGKIIMCDHEVFDKFDAAMLCHPRHRTEVLRGGLACVDVTYGFHGRSAHAASAPEQGVSALEALITAFVAINAARQFLPARSLIHGIITHGGTAPNVVPAFAEAKFILRARDVKELFDLRRRVDAITAGAAAAFGATCTSQSGLVYAERLNNVELAGVFRRNLESIGVQVHDPEPDGGLGSSDIGNVGHRTATIHPYIAIGRAMTHTREFAEAAASDDGMAGMLQAAKALALTAFDLATDSALLQRVRAEFAEAVQGASHMENSRIASAGAGGDPLVRPRPN